ncbi:MAG: hypothetical protein ACL7BU_06320 [Candidatus Phlomobacter fragariae]
MIELENINEDEIPESSHKEIEVDKINDKQDITLESSLLHYDGKISDIQR